ncbi:hypothetical protein BGX20_002673, partial [Mortierella sp. AD010]
IQIFKRGRAALTDSEFDIMAHVYKKITSPDTPEEARRCMESLGKRPSQQISELERTAPGMLQVSPCQVDLTPTLMVGLVAQRRKSISGPTQQARTTNSIRPEVFLDESYCHLDHSAANWWVPKNGGIVSEPDRKPLLVIFGAFVAWYSKKKKMLQAKFVKNSLHIWPAIGKSHLPKQPKAGADKYDAVLWNRIPPEVREAEIIADDRDCHGNFTAVVFDCIFKKLCQNLINMDFSPCNIRLDGASYHFRKINKKPTITTHAEPMRQWLMENNDGQLPGTNRRDGIPTKKEMMKVINTIHITPHYTIYDIAKANGEHQIFKTPPPISL